MRTTAPRSHGILSAIAFLAIPAPAAAESPHLIEIAKGIRLRSPPGWQERDRVRNAVELAKRAGESIVARAIITTEDRGSPVQAIERLADIAAEQSPPATIFTVSGWPAIERLVATDEPRVGAPHVTTPAAPPRSTLASTLAVAAGATLVRIETTLAPGADPRLLDELAAHARKLDITPKADPTRAKHLIDELRRAIHARAQPPPRLPPAPTAPPGR